MYPFSMAWIIFWKPGRFMVVPVIPPSTKNKVLVIYKQSTISYPSHNHVSVYMLGFVLEAAIKSITDTGSNIYRENGKFVILPYTPHCVNAQSCYTLLSLCINAELVPALELEGNPSSVVDFLHNSINQPTVEEKSLKHYRALSRSVG